MFMCYGRSIEMLECSCTEALVVTPCLIGPQPCFPLMLLHYASFSSLLHCNTAQYGNSCPDDMFVYLADLHLDLASRTSSLHTYIFLSCSMSPLVVFYTSLTIPKLFAWL
jgi:hypothetical protein